MKKIQNQRKVKVKVEDQKKKECLQRQMFETALDDAFL